MLANIILRFRLIAMVKIRSVFEIKKGIFKMPLGFVYGVVLFIVLGKRLVCFTLDS